MSQLFEYLNSAIKQITGNAYRTFMTMLGIIIGIAAVITVIALGNGMSDYITNQFNSISGTSGTVSLDSKKTTERINMDDMKEIKATLTDINGVSPMLYPEGVCKIKGSKETVLASVQGGTDGAFYEKGGAIVAGKYFTAQQMDASARVCVIGEGDAKKLFGTTQCVGMTVELAIGSKSADYTIVGVRENVNSLLDMLMSEADEYYAMVELPYTSLGADFDIKIDDITYVSIFANPSILEERTKQAGDIIGQNHGVRGTDAIHTSVSSGLGDIFGSSLSIARKFLMVVAAISLLVGGIGVMNIMMVSVTERTREIGIRKSIGARTEAIMIQFLAESALLTVMGGLIGILVGLIIAFFMCKQLGFTLIISPTAIVGAALFSVAIGVFFGIYPARKAAKMKPIDALRT